MSKNYIFTIKSLRPNIVNIIGEKNNNYYNIKQYQDNIYDYDNLLKISGEIVNPLKSRSALNP